MEPQRRNGLHRARERPRKPIWEGQSSTQRKAALLNIFERERGVRPPFWWISMRTPALAILSGQVPRASHLPKRSSLGQDLPTYFSILWLLGRM